IFTLSNMRINKQVSKFTMAMINKMEIVTFLFTFCTFNTSNAVTNSSKSNNKYDCNYSNIKGDEFTFGKILSGYEKKGYTRWLAKPNFSSNKLPYNDYLGRSGKITKEIIKDKNDWSYYKVVLENCEVVYHDDANYLESEYNSLNIYRKYDLEKAKSLINKTIWINNLNNPFVLKLITSDPAVSYGIENTEKVTVTDIILESYGHGQPKGSFLIKVKKASGEEGLIKFSKDYFYENDPIPVGTPSDMVQAIQKNNIKIGMPPEYVTLSWGKPEKVNKTIGAWGVHEQWIYGDQFVYFENEKLTSSRTSQ
ncbi:MAG: hypothetical protein JZU65_20495, partial [Chlorobium sp.]|nr:hypothetical protein [Chlorobium sp.]